MSRKRTEKDKLKEQSIVRTTIIAGKRRRMRFKGIVINYMQMPSEILTDLTKTTKHHKDRSKRLPRNRS